MDHAFATLAFGIPLALGGHLGWITLVQKLHAGRFHVSVDSPQQLSFDSSEGKFTANFTHGKLTWKEAGVLRSIALEKIRKIDYLVQEEEALGSEFLLGFDFTDLFGRYRDTVDMHRISAITSEGTIPLFRSGRLQRREFFASWIISIEDALLRRIGLVKDVDAQANEARAVLSRLEIPGH